MNKEMDSFAEAGLFAAEHYWSLILSIWCVVMYRAVWVWHSHWWFTTSMGHWSQPFTISCMVCYMLSWMQLIEQMETIMNDASVVKSLFLSEPI